ncbi:glycoside hydrolase superfamily [Boeremia exigua]|uniref:glycoside hydrolase superfamily n=1 Tax=Boeremia exigua TaxID=749465 RepID=UPI001E8DDD9E|nr:glycoside hydrolase superfamily [Boeremia exigua]KAH6644816.1 glycoside hydrolase superfamily [Boeremia exigua]
MRLSFIASAFIGLAACSSPSAGDSDLALFGAPRHNLDGVLPVLDIEEQYIRSQTDGSVKAFGGTNLQCSAANPCPDGSCCNSQGQCGYRDEHCKESCVATCDAKAPCGVNSKNGGQACPLNVCCSHFGFCGASEAFCRDETASGQSTPCQKGFGKCGTVKSLAQPSCGTGSGTASRKIAYYEGWNTRRRPCDKVWPANIDTTGLTHLIFSFATIDPVTFAVSPMHPDDEKLYADFFALKDGSQKWIGIGGWEFSDAGATRYTWSQMASSKTNRDAFIASLSKFLDKWSFQGIDIDWEWPGAETRGGNPAIDKQNQIDLMKELRAALGSRGLSVVVPAQYEYLKNLDPKSLESNVDFLNILAYDLHGPWDASIPGLGPLIKPHTDLKEIDTALDLLWFNDVTPAKVNLGVANYGRGYTLADAGCTHLGCTWNGPSQAGECTELAGILSQCEIQRLIGQKNLQPEIIKDGAGVKQIIFDGQWVGYDDKETLGLKTELANDRCLGGTALWAIDYASCGGGPGGPGAPQSSSAVPVPSAPGVSVAPSVPASSAPASWTPEPSASAPISSTPDLSSSTPVVSSVSGSVTWSSETSLPPPAQSSQVVSSIGSSAASETTPWSSDASSAWTSAQSSQIASSTAEIISPSTSTAEIISPSTSTAEIISPSTAVSESAPWSSPASSISQTVQSSQDMSTASQYTSSLASGVQSSEAVQTSTDVPTSSFTSGFQSSDGATTVIPSVSSTGSLTTEPSASLSSTNAFSSAASSVPSSSAAWSSQDSSTASSVASRLDFPRLNVLWAEFTVAVWERCADFASVFNLITASKFKYRRVFVSLRTDVDDLNNSIIALKYIQYISDTYTDRLVWRPLS